MSDMELQQHRSKRQRTVGSSQLCLQCQELDLDKGFEEAAAFYQNVKDGKTSLPSDLCQAANGKYFYNDAILVHRFYKRLSSPSDCPLCQFFQSLRVNPKTDECYKLLAFRSSESWMFRLDVLQEARVLDRVQDTVFMVVVPDYKLIPPGGHEEEWMERDIPTIGTIYRLKANESRETDPDILLRARELNEKADLKLVEGWLEACRAHHTGACQRQRSSEAIEKGFRVIDCCAELPKVVEQQWGITYAALSYVWGTSTADREDWPKTVLDAVAVTKTLGLQYLWVDRLCINQLDKEEKGYMISRMTTIYEEADFTIIAAAGSGADHGLPGVRSTARKPQPKYHLDSGSLLLSTLPDPRRDILESAYWTRAWTYQEGILSKRRIVFTQSQVYYECKCMATNESVNMPLFMMGSASEDDTEMRMADFMLTGAFKDDAYSGGSLSNQSDLIILQDDPYRLDYGFPVRSDVTTIAQLRGLNEHIREFSTRNLSFDTDVLPALLGILGIYKANKSLLLLHGLSIWLDNISGGKPGPQLTFCLSITSWYHRASQNHELFVSTPCERRSHLPSWTWAGWKGPVSWRTPPQFEHGAFMSGVIASDNMKFLWAADVYLYGPDQTRPIRLASFHAAERLKTASPTLIELRDPPVLKYFRRTPTRKEWAWTRKVGRVGRRQYQGGNADWDAKWHRIAGRLCFIGVSVLMTADEWTARHDSGELVSVLMFASQEPASEHARARFLTLRKVSTGDAKRAATAGMATVGQWERVGVLSLTIPKVSLLKCAGNADFLKQIPVRKWEGVVVIQ